MIKITKILNVKLPFVEAIEHLKIDEQIKGCICLTEDKPIVAFNNTNGLNIIEYNDIEVDSLFPNKNLTLNNILTDDWFLII